MLALALTIAQSCGSSGSSRYTKPLHMGNPSQFDLMPKDRLPYRNLTKALGDEMIESGETKRLRGILEYRDDGHFIKGYFLVPIENVKYPGYQLQGIIRHNKIWQQYWELKKTLDESSCLYITLVGSIEKRGAVDYQINPDTEPFGNLRNYGQIRLNKGSLPSWAPYKGTDKK